MPMAQALGRQWRRGRARAPGPARRARRRRVRLGDADVPIAAVLVREPDRVGGLFVASARGCSSASDAPRDAASWLPGSPGELLVPAGPAAGQRRRGVGGRPAARRIRMPAGGARRATCSRRWHRFTDRLATYLTLAGLTALLTGGLGIGLAIEAISPAHRHSIATHEMPGRRRRPDVRGSTWSRSSLLAGSGALALGLVLGLLLPLAVCLVPEGVAPGRCRLRRLRPAVAASRLARAADRVRVCASAAGGRPRRLARRASSGLCWRHRRTAGRAGAIW